MDLSWDIPSKLEGKGETALILYLGLFLAVNFTGFTFFSESVWAPYLEDPAATDDPDGSLYIYDNQLTWVADGTQYRLMADTSDSQFGTDGTSGPAGSVWISGSEFLYIDGAGDAYWVQGSEYDSSPAASPGDVWIDPGTEKLHYVGEDGVEYWMEDTTDDYIW